MFDSYLLGLFIVSDIDVGVLLIKFLSVFLITGFVFLICDKKI